MEWRKTDGAKGRRMEQRKTDLTKCRERRTEQRGDGWNIELQTEQMEEDVTQKDVQNKERRLKWRKTDRTKGEGSKERKGWIKGIRFELRVRRSKGKRMNRRKTDGAKGGGGKMNREKLTELWKKDGMEKDGWRKGRRIE
jgi:hypothetical protein